MSAYSYHFDDVLGRILNKISNDICEEIVSATKSKPTSPKPKASNYADKVQQNAEAFGNGMQVAAYDITLTENNTYNIYIDVPGVDKNDIKLEFVNSCLHVSANRKAPYTTTSQQSCLFKSVSYGPVSVEIELSDDIDPESINAFYNNGVLYVSLSKIHQKQHVKQIPIM
jgi:HSP20 family molecular chaperone IbpA